MKFIFLFFFLTHILVNNIDSTERRVNESTSLLVNTNSAESKKSKESNWCCWKSKKSSSNLLEAVIENNLEKAENLSDEEIQKGIDFQDEYGKTPLMWALENGNIELANFIFDRNPNIKLVDNERCTVLHYAIQEEDNRFIKKLLSHNNINSVKNKQDKCGNTPLMRALLQKREDIASSLITDENLIIKNKQNETAEDIARKKSIGKFIIEETGRQRRQREIERELRRLHNETAPTVY
jgi:ankyrin repeat protein